MKNLTVKEFTNIARLLGFKMGLTSNHSIYNDGGKGTFSYKGNNTWTLSINTVGLNDSGLVRSIEVNTTYWQHTEQTNKLNAFLQSGPKSYIEVIEFLTTNKQ